MNKDRVEGKVKDVAGRIERQAGEWTGDSNAQAHGAMKQVEGKVQNAWGQAKDAADKAVEDAKARNNNQQKDEAPEANEKQGDLESRRKAS
jgi:uncharacterized protein YjbJ (UPF0337 family)